MQGYLKDSKKLAEYIVDGVFVHGQRIQPVDHGYEALQELHNTAYDSDARTYPLFRRVDVSAFHTVTYLVRLLPIVVTHHLLHS